MQVLWLLIFCLLTLNPLFSVQIHQYKNYINFNNLEKKGNLPEDFAGYTSLRRWANYQGLILQADSPLFGLKDGICRMVPSEGLDFQLDIDPLGKYRANLFLDLTSYSNMNNKDYPVRFLKVYINQTLKKTVYFHRDREITNPVKIPLELVDYADGKIRVHLEPGTNLGRFWGIWDAFYTYQNTNSSAKAK
ncbi:MAG: hypothetical protein AAF518_15005 [Spirochaetota bacterium]